jgi:nitrite reductase/ring-hydroxylating ferredoxin subunit
VPHGRTARRRPRGFDPENSGQDSLFVVRQGGRLFGYRDQCPHYGDTRWRGAGMPT